MSEFDNENPYKPVPVRLSRSWIETEDNNVKSFLFDFVNPEDAEKFEYLPGQFCQISIWGWGEAPFGIASSPVEGKQLLFSVNRIGTLTNRLHATADNEIIGLRGPLGNIYPVELFKDHDVVIVGGGYAFTTLRSLFLFLVDPANRDKYGKITVLYGARTPGLFLYREELEAWSNYPNVEFVTTIDNPHPDWDGVVGLIPPVLKDIAPNSENAFAIVCGPPIMIRFTLPILTELGFPEDRIYLSLEMRMKCGIGKCGRCNLGHKYVCVDGPVFSMAELNGLVKDM